MERRAFLRNLAAGAALTGIPGAARSSEPRLTSGTIDRAPVRLRVLVLGGRNYVGPHLVQAALERGHEVTMFNRGFTQPDLFPHVEHLVGNRFDDRGPGLDALRDDREWDVVLDTWMRAPGCVNDTARLLSGRAERYVYISSMAVFPGYDEHGMDEASPTVDADDWISSYESDLGYRVRKRAGELAAQRHFGDAAVILRCGTVNGFDASASTTNQQTYWPLRFMSGEPVMVPDDTTAVIQWTDARDVGRFAVHAAEHGLAGIFHLMNTREPIPLLDYFDAWHRATGRRSTVVRAPRSFLMERGIRPWDDLRVWIPGDDGFFRIRSDRARDTGTGFAFRPLGETLADVQRTWASPPAPAVTDGLARQRELELIWELAGAELAG